MAGLAPPNAFRTLLAAAAEEWRATPFYRASQKSTDSVPIRRWANDPRTGDPVRGFDLVRGQWRIGAERLAGVNSNPWPAPAPSTHFTARLHSFSWLADLVSVGVAGHQAAAGLIDAWVRDFRDWHPAAWAPELTGERLFAWLAHGREAFAQLPSAPQVTALQSFVRQARHLRAACKDIRDPSARLKAGATLALCGVALSGRGEDRGLDDASAILDQGMEMVDEECARQFLLDGGHASRAPEALLDASCDLSTVVRELTAVGVAPPRLAMEALPRLLPMVRFFQLGDGGLACFNGGGEGVRAAIVALQKSGARAPSFQFATHSGFQRLAANDSILLMDVGEAPSPLYGERAHAGALSFEFSVGVDRLIINVGSARELSPDWRAAGRATNGHSTLTIEDALSAQFSQRRMGRGAAHPVGPGAIHARRTEEEDGAWIDSHHDGYRAQFGYLHRRRLYLRRDGCELRGQDAVAAPLGVARPPKPAHFAVRFHVHPSVRVERCDIHAATLTPPNGPAWKFVTDARAMEIEKSVYLSGVNTPDTRARQIVLRGVSDPARAEDCAPNLIKWKLTRVA
jgi:uncharacterized heparinase superfamily protein